MDLKTIFYSFSASAAISSGSINNVLATFDPITIDIPDLAPGGAIKKAILEYSADDRISATGGTFNVRRLQLQAGVVTPTGSWTNTNAYTNSGENISLYHSVDATYFLSSSWGPVTQSLALTASYQISQSGGTTPGLNNPSLTLAITYEYNESSSLQIKTVLIPLDASGSAQPAALGTQTFGTVPALDTYLPETNKNYKDFYIITQGNTGTSAAIYTSSIQLGTGIIRHNWPISSSLASDRWHRYVWKLASGSFDTTSPQSFRYSVQAGGKDHHAQAWMAATYTYDETGSTSIMNSVLLPMQVSAIMGPSALDFVRAKEQFWVQETNPSLQRKAFYMFFQSNAAVTGLAARIGTGSFIPYNDVATQVCGGNGLMIRNDTGSLVRGLNELTVDVYRTSTTVLGFATSGFWLLNYSSSKHPSGSSWHNKTIWWNIFPISSSAAAANIRTDITNSPAIPIPGQYPFVNNYSYIYNNVSDTTSGLTGFGVRTEATGSETGSNSGGNKWFNIQTEAMIVDPETGLRTFMSSLRPWFLRYPNDADYTRLDPRVNRRWEIFLSAGTAFHHLDNIITYHRITYNISGTVSGGTGALISMSVIRPSTNEILFTSSLNGNDTFNRTWYDNVNPVYIVAQEISTTKGDISIRSTSSNSSNPFNIGLSDEYWF